MSTTQRWEHCQVLASPDDKVTVTSYREDREEELSFPPESGKSIAGRVIGRLGQDGWELVTYVSPGAAAWQRWFFKRPVAQVGTDRQWSN